MQRVEAIAVIYTGSFDGRAKPLSFVYIYFRTVKAAKVIDYTYYNEFQRIIRFR